METIFMEFGFGDVPFCCSCKPHVPRLFSAPCVLHMCPLLNDYWGTTCPYPLTQVTMEVVSPCSLDTCWKVLICLAPRTFTSSGTFWTLVSSPLHICDGDTISHLSLISFNNLNQLPITVGFAPIALAIDKFLVFLIEIDGFHLRKPLSHLHLALPVLSLKPGFRLFTFAYW